MNAYELAYKLNNALGVDYEMLEQSSIMLRQQADLIRNLQKSLGFKNSGYETINLTPQTKPLSDEEIDKIIYSVDWAYDPVLLARAIEERHGIK